MNMQKTTLFALNEALAPYGAKISTKDSLLQMKSAGYIGEEFKSDKRPVYDFQVVCIKTGLSFADINSPIYQKLPHHIREFFFNSYFETKQRIYA